MIYDDNFDTVTNPNDILTNKLWERLVTPWGISNDGDKEAAQISFKAPPSPLIGSASKVDLSGHFIPKQTVKSQREQSSPVIITDTDTSNDDLCFT